jgi:photosystem II stability/assembly factor-like uncharacterized protein
MSCAIGRERVHDGLERAVILRSSNGGRTWERQFVDQGHWFYDVFFLDRQTGWACGDNGLVLRSTDSGHSWVKQLTSIRSPLIKIQFVNGQFGWALAERGMFVRTVNGGATWQAIRITTPARLRSFHFSNTNDGWIIGENGEVYRSTDGGLTWTSYIERIRSALALQVNEAVRFRAVKVFESKVCFIAGTIVVNNGSESTYRGALFKTTDAGNSWSTMIVGGELGLISADIRTSSNIWIVTQFGQLIFHTLDGGLKWTQTRPVSDGGIPLWISFGPTDTGLVIVTYGSFADDILYTTDGGKNWLKSELPSSE